MINKVRREGELHPAFSWDFCEVFVRISNKMHDIVEGQILPCLSKIWSHFQFLGPHYIFYNIISRITLDLCSMHRVIAFGFRVRLISVLCACSPKNKSRGFEKHLPHGIIFEMWACNDVSTRRRLCDIFLIGSGFFSLFFIIVEEISLF